MSGDTTNPARGSRAATARPHLGVTDRGVAGGRGPAAGDASTRAESPLDFEAQEQEILWRPSQAILERSNLTRYVAWLQASRGLAFDGYDALWRWSVTELEQFWASIWDYFEVVSSVTYAEVLAARAMPGARWFPGARLNYAENLFAGKQAERPALVHASETQGLQTLNWGQLREQVSRCAAGMRALGVRSGDRVVAWLPNGPEAVIAFLASAWIGAIWSSCSPEVGAASVLDRFAQVEPKLLLGVEAYRYGGREFDRRDELAALVDGLPSLTHAILAPSSPAGPIEDRLEELAWDQLLLAGDGEPAFAQVPFDHPLWILYSSGTSGPPKPIVQGHGGILLEQLKQSHLHLDAQAGDRVFWFTTTGWMMWNYLVGVLHTDAAIVLYDGDPGYPDLGALWQLAAHAKVTLFGTSAAFVAACKAADIAPAEGRDLAALRAVGVTGSSLAPEGFSWIYKRLGDDVWLFSCSGGTDVCSALVGGVPTLPVWRGELQARALGCAVEAWDDSGRALVGAVGELVITEPMPSMPLFLWGDVDGSRYRDSYFSTFDGVWRHGDWIELSRRGTAVIHGRSDATINRGGIRMGTAEIYRAVLAVPEVLDALVVDVPRADGDWMPLFVVLRDGEELGTQLSEKISREIRRRCSPRHVPNAIYAVDSVPRTLTGKLLEIPVKRILTGSDPDAVLSRGALSDPSCVDWFVDLASKLTTASEHRRTEKCP